MTASPPTMAEQSAEQQIAVREWGIAESLDGKTQAIYPTGEDWDRFTRQDAVDEHNAVVRELRAALAREVEAKKDRDDWKECYRFENECFLNAGVEHDRRIEALAAAEARCAEMGKALEDIAGGMIPSPILNPALAAFEATGDKLPFKEMMIVWLQERARAAIAKPGSKT